MWIMRALSIKKNRRLNFLFNFEICPYNLEQLPLYLINTRCEQSHGSAEHTRLLRAENNRHRNPA